MKRVAVVGAGAAGLMCAIEAGKRGHRVVVLERSDAMGKKIRISGGGRCNFTNVHTMPEHFICGNPHFHKSALARYTPADFIALVEKHGIRYHEKKWGQLFCDGSADEIVALLNKECARAGVEIRLNCDIRSIAKRKEFHLHTNAAEIECDALVIATGGLSIPRIGATAFGYGVAKQFGLRVTPLRPALVPLLVSGEEGKLLHELRGVSLEAIVRCGKASFQEKLLFTHRGLSGPAILQISSYWKPGESIFIDPLPPLTRSFIKMDAEEKRRQDWQIHPAGTEGYAKAEVTLGGVDTNELSSVTMESRRVPGLYFIGEVVDVTGQLGGYNFQWAWASGYAAGQAVGN